ncbi:MAG: hypothetical protein H6617_07120 [Bdellovibrionaceae bacterium]|nr:hypothetical protein [Bdellovibrionales bacterium]MCB9254438.1 hypothetical protein [Pseudobdellovibrionaceae bacterium]
MKSVAELNNLHPGADIYVIGTGTSFRVFPKDFFEGKITIGLNLAWQLLPVTYGLTTRPELNIPEFIDQKAPNEIVWVTKYHKLITEEQREHGKKHFYFFRSDGQANTQPPGEPSDSGKVLDWVRKSTEDYLYLWSSVSQTAANLAANMGARNVILVGCDNGALVGNHHAQNQHTMWKGVNPDHRYRQYYDGLVEVRQALRSRGVNLLSMTPFVHLLEPTLDFRSLCKELNCPEWINNSDISKEVDEIYSLREKFGHFIQQKQKSARSKLKSYLSRVSS